MDEFAPGLLLEIAYTRRRAEGIISGLEYQTNLHLLKLATVPMPEQCAHLRHEVTTWLSTIAAIRLKPTSKPGSRKFYFTILFEEPFGQNEVPAVMARLQLLRQQYGQIKTDIQPDILVRKLRDFHLAFAEGCASGRMDPDTINRLIASF